MVSKDAPFLAGLALGAALERQAHPARPRHSPCALCRDWRRLAAVRGRASALALVPAVRASSPPSRRGQRLAFLRHVVGYRSIQEYWGVELIVRVIHDALRERRAVAAARSGRRGHLRAGRRACCSSRCSWLLLVWQWLDERRRLEGYALAALSYVVFLVFASGFGVQYAGAAVRTSRRVVSTDWLSSTRRSPGFFSPGST